MTPKEKAEELVKKNLTAIVEESMDGNKTMFYIAKQCAIIAVDVILIDCGAKDWLGDEACEGKNYWQQVKEELQKM